MAVDPTAPVSPILPTAAVGSGVDSSAILQALARQALANATAQLAGIATEAEGHSAQTHGQVEQAGQSSAEDPERAATAQKERLAHTVQTIAPKPRSAQEVQIARAVRAATAEAVPRQAGIAPLMADIAAFVDTSGSPPEVSEAARKVLSAIPTVPEVTNAVGLRHAVERSGVLLEAHLARAEAAPASGAAPRNVAHDGDLKAALLVFRGALSAWLGRAELVSRPADQSRATAMPRGDDGEQDLTDLEPARPTGRRDGGRLAASAPIPISPTTGPPVAAPPRGAGVSEGRAPPLIAPDSLGGPASQAAPQAIDPEIEARFGAFVAPSQKGAEPSAPKTGFAKPTSPALIQVEHLDVELDAPEAEPAEPRPPVARGYGAPADEARARTPAPPYAGGPTAGQKPVPVSPQPWASPEATARRLLKGTQSALARQELMQVASLPDSMASEHETAEPRPLSTKLNFDLPFVTPQGVAVAQFEISRDGGGAGGAGAATLEQTYRARFSIDVEPLGPVHAQVVLAGSRARVSLWAERSETIARLRAGEEALGAALRDAELTPEVAVHSGAPPTAGDGPVGHFVDQAS